jgi:putative membrane protein
MRDFFKTVIIFSQDYWVLPILICVLVFGLFIFFMLKYWHPANELNADFQDMIKDARLPKNPIDTVQNLNSVFAQEPFSHAWQMYHRTLHPVYEQFEGEQRVVGYKSTAPSGYFFDQIFLVDTPLKIEFFKHLPSLITGIGIIGTFAGLLLGLAMFDPAGDPANVQDSLDNLLHGVSEAFVASGFAILMAMCITSIEKSKLRLAYASLEELTTAIDSLFEADTLGEEHLEKLVGFAEQNLTNTTHMKENLISELRPVLQNMLDDLQAKNQHHQNQMVTAMATQIGQSITDSLQAPLEKIAGSVQQMTGDQGSAVQDLLTDVLTAFMNRLESTFGSQMTGMSDMMSQSVTAMREMQLGFNQLIGDMRSNSEASSKALEQQMLNMLTEIQQKQNEMGSTMNDMLDKVQQSVAQIGDTGAEAAQKMSLQIADMLSQINSSLGGMMTHIGEKQLEQDKLSAERQHALHQTTTQLMDDLTSQITRLLEESQTAIQSNRQNIDKLSQVSLSSITSMNDGAEKMRLAAERFSTAGQSLSHITEGSSALLSQINTVSNSLTTTTTQLHTLVSDYQKSRDIVNQAIQVLEKLIDTARQEAGMSSQMLSDMQQMTQALQGVKQDMQQYLGEVNDVLAKSLGSFSSGVEATLNRSLLAFDNTLDLAVKRLSSGIEDLGGATEELAEMIQRNARRS